MKAGGRRAAATRRCRRASRLRGRQRARCRGVDPRRRGRVLAEQTGGPDGSRDEVATTVRAYAEAVLLDAANAERALVRADPGCWRVGRKVEVAALAVRSQLQHVPCV